jgi:hypothetical protein
MVSSNIPYDIIPNEAARRSYDGREKLALGVLAFSLVMIAFVLVWAVVTRVF